jgi:TP901 family phage tail tape measure protein
LSETLRDLVVSLSLNSDNFTRNIKSIQKQIQEAESAFRLASAGVEKFESTTAGLSSKLSTLERTLSLQKDAVDQYERALTQASGKLQECYDRQNDYNQRMTDAKTKQAQLKQEVVNAATAYNHYKQTLGEADSATIAAKANLDSVKVEYRDSAAEVKKLEGQNVALKKTTQNAADAFSSAQTRLNGAKAAVRETTSVIEQCNRQLALSQTQWSAAGETIVRSEQAVASIGRQMKNAESRFKLAAAGIKDFDKSAGGLTAKLTLLGEKLVLQRQAVEQYERALAAAKEQLAAAQSVGDDDKIREATDAVQDAEAALNNARAAVKQTQADIAACNKELKTAKSEWTAAGKSLEDFSKKCETVSKNMTRVGRVLTTTVTAPILALGASAIKASISYESAFASVRKTVDASDSEFQELSDDIEQMSTKVAASADDIAEVVAVAGQLGIRNEHLMEFARTMIDLGNSTDIVADEAASTLAKFANIMDMDQSLFQNLGSTLVELGNNYATTESAIMEMSMRLAGAGKQVGLTEAQILGFATALSSVGIEAQMGGSAFSKALVKMEVASATGGQALEDFGAVSGMTAQQFKTLWDVDPAAAFQAFIVGLSRLDDEGESAIAVLEEIGISEIRLRDTLLRATNATDLFANTQVTAIAAWEENTALTEEAGKRYATTESKLINLKNTAMLFARQLGNDMNPTIQKLIDGASSLLEKFMVLDETQRAQIIRFAAIAASVGPAALMLGKLSKGLGIMTGGIGKFATAVGKAGGGFSGFLSVLSKSPSVWLAVAAAVVVGTVALADYVSGAKDAREALKGMEETAESWKNIAAETFYGNSEGLSFFGMSESDFARDAQSAQDWLNGLLAVWSDGQEETDEIVNAWTESFKTLTASTREELQGLKDTADESGYTSVSDQLAADIAALDDMDAEIAKLLKKRKNGNFTEKDKIRLQELIDAREAIEVKYKLSPADADSFDTVLQKVEAEVARAQARGQSDVGITVYENAVVGLAEGMAAVNTQLDEQYDKEHAVIQLIEDDDERRTAQEALDAKYREDRRAAALEYAQALSQVVMPVWEQEDIQEAGTQVDTLLEKLRAYSMAGETEKPALLTELQELSANMDEGSLTEYLSLMTQIQSLMDSGLTETEIADLFPEIDFTAQMDQFAGIADYIGLIKDDLPGLYSMFNESLPEETLKITTDLDMTGAQARWDAFAANPGAITTDAVITGYAESETATAQQPKVEAFITKYTEIPEGADVAALTPTGLMAYVAAYSEATSGADVSALNPTNVTAMVSAYKELAAGVDVSTLKPDEITAYIASYLEKEGVDTSKLTPNAITAFVLAYEEVTGGALTTELTPDDITAMVAKYLEAESVDLSALTPGQIEAIVNSYAEATGCDKSKLLPSLTAYITEYREAEGVTVPKPQTRVVITGYDYLAYQGLKSNTDLELEVPVHLGELDQDELDQMLADGKVKFWKDGVEVPIEAVPDGTVTADSVATLDRDGTLHILITPEVTGTQEAIDSISPMVDEVDQLGVTWAGMWAGVMPTTTMDMIDSAIGRLDSYQKTLDYSAWDKFWASLRGESTDKGALDTSMKLDFDAETVAQLSAYVSEMVAAIQQGQTVSEEDLTNLQNIVTFLNGLDVTDTGAHVREGVAQGMTEAGWDSDAETVATNLETALNQALQINSPSKRVKPVGSGTAEGIALGMTEYGFATDASTVAQNLQTALAAVLTATTLQSTGINAMNGLKMGIQTGTLGVVTAMRLAARAAVAAAKNELKIASPSRVFRDEVGAMTMKGFGDGVVRESRVQAKIIQNAARYLTGEAKVGGITTTSNDNRRTYNSQNTISFAGSNFYVNDKQDAYALAVEIASLTRRQQRGKGVRMA